MFPQRHIPSALYLQPYVPQPNVPFSPSFPQPYVPSTLYSLSAMFPQPNIHSALCSLHHRLPETKTFSQNCRPAMFSVPCIFIHSKPPGFLLPLLSCVYLALYSQNACVCGCLCVCVCVCARLLACLEYSLKIVSRDMILGFKNTLILNS